jgi:hypothetical protein
MKRSDFLRSILLGVGSLAILPVLNAVGINEKNIAKLPNTGGGNIASDFTITSGGDIRYIGADECSYTVKDLHRFLQDQADDLHTHDSVIDITSANPSILITDQQVVLPEHLSLNESARNHLNHGSILEEKTNNVYGGDIVIDAKNETFLYDSLKYRGKSEDVTQGMLVIIKD